MTFYPKSQPNKLPNYDNINSNLSNKIIIYLLFYCPEKKKIRQ